MSEVEVTSRTPLPRTRQSLVSDLLNTSLTPGITVLVHSSLSSLGWVCGGSVAVVQALMDVITPAGTLVIPTFSGDYSDPSMWQAPPVPVEWWSIIRETMPAFDPRVTPTRNMGKIAETFRTCSNVLRSSHPAVSFAAWGKNAEEIVRSHSLDNSLGENSPLARLYDLNSWVLLLGVGYDKCTCFHLSEYRIGGRCLRRATPTQVSQGAPILEGEQRVWKSYMDIQFQDDCFVEIGAAFELAGYVQVSKVGSAQVKLFAIRTAVDFAVSWLTANPK